MHAFTDYKYKLWYKTAQTAVHKISGNYSCTALSEQYTHEWGTKWLLKTHNLQQATLASLVSQLLHMT